jgi:hypothetical protein
VKMIDADFPPVSLLALEVGMIAGRASRMAATPAIRAEVLVNAEALDQLFRAEPVDLDAVRSCIASIVSLVPGSEDVND